MKFPIFAYDSEITNDNRGIRYASCYGVDRVAIAAELVRRANAFDELLKCVKTQRAVQSPVTWDQADELIAKYSDVHTHQEM